MRLLRDPLSQNKTIVLGVAGTLGVLAMWELLIRSGAVSKPGLPVPTRVMAQAAELLGNTVFLNQVFTTIGEWLLGLGVAAIAGILVGGLMGAFPAVFVAFEYPVEAFRTLPSIAVGPILVLLLGAGVAPIAITVALSSIWPILLNTLYGVRGTDPTAVATARTLGVRPLGLLMQIRLVSALPFAFTGVRVAASIGLIVTVSAELLIGSGQGIGGYILLASTNAGNLDGVYAATIIAGVLGVLINAAFALLDRTAFNWKKGLAQ
ncbi:ABC transporter permease [Paenarthrobacter nitroguajacolicus]|uniref:ABC transporter permease n=1 Tax=Paenarthrobacter nitroguajacolicus TaxID=211146 RepID=A0A558H4I6_PAENT|nr:ABC transporter permease [Paenarthrobacter nitroguajacolicus]TVU64001.1 ABC transporter permease [Paenarthrobacter nitroguajacolicus]